MTQHDHDHPHDHDHDLDHGRSLGLFEHYHGPAGEPGDADLPLDAANQSLADALHQSFRILKGIMVLLVVFYLGSGIRFIEPTEEAVVFRFGELLPTAHASGALFAWPFPVDEVVRLPVRQSSDIIIDSHMLWLSEDDKSKGLKFVDRGHEGLDPNRDGALLTGDKGLVHIQWVVTYKISDLVQYIRNLHGKKMAPAEELIRVLVENAGVEVASGMKTEEVYRERLDDVCAKVKARVNARLTSLATGMTLTQVKAPVSIVPLQVRGAFEETQQAENNKVKLVQDAQKSRTELLSNAAGRVFEDILAVLEQKDISDASGDAAAAAKLDAELDRLLTSDAAGEAGQRIKGASAHYSTLVGELEGDLGLYRSLLPEFKRNPRLLFERLWDETRNELLSNREVVKIYRPVGLAQMRIRIGPDPQQKKLDEIESNIKKIGGKPPEFHAVDTGFE